MFYSLKLYFKDPWVATPFLASAILAVANWWYIITKIKSTSDQIFLHYNILFGIDLAGAWWKVLLLPSLALAICVVNGILSLALYGKEKLLGRILPLAAALAEGLLLAATFFVIGLNS